MYPLFNRSDIFIGIKKIERKSALIPGCAAPTK
jgi:hypothetical protein